MKNFQVKSLIEAENALKSAKAAFSAARETRLRVKAGNAPVLQAINGLISHHRQQLVRMAALEAAKKAYAKAKAEVDAHVGEDKDLVSERNQLKLVEDAEKAAKDVEKCELALVQHTNPETGKVTIFEEVVQDLETIIVGAIVDYPFLKVEDEYVLAKLENVLRKENEKAEKAEKAASLKLHWAEKARKELAETAALFKGAALGIKAKLPPAPPKGEVVPPVKGKIKVPA